MKSLGLRFGIRSLIATVLFSVLLDVLHLNLPVQDMLLATVYGGLFCGLGFGLILRGSATTGGTDMLASLIHRLIPSIRVSWGIFVIDGLVIIASAFVFDMMSAMYALIVTMICNIVIDVVLEGPNSSHSFFIISDRSDEIARRIMDELDRGVTVLYGRSGYLCNNTEIIISVVSNREVHRIQKLVKSIDPECFMIVTRVTEVWGRGFSHGKHYRTEK
jgi:uncharacterized membrane-anchored protein YitT (DUF2179 family)